MQQLSCNIGLFPNKKCWQCKTKKVFFKNSNQFGSKRHLELTIENIGLYLDEKHQTLTNWYWWELGNCSLLFRKYLRLSSSFCKYVWVRCNTIIIIALIGTHIKATFVPFTVFFYIQSCMYNFALVCARMLITWFFIVSILLLPYAKCTLVDKGSLSLTAGRQTCQSW